VEQLIFQQQEEVQVLVIHVLEENQEDLVVEEDLVVLQEAQQAQEMLEVLVHQKEIMEVSETMQHHLI
jgi:hypothetical protein